MSEELPLSLKRFDDGLKFDDGFKFDDYGSDFGFDIISVSDIDYYEIFNEDLDANIICEATVEFLDSKYLDLTRLVPTKFLTSEILQVLLQDMAVEVGTWIAKIDALNELQDPYLVSQDFAPHLAKLLGLDLVNTSEMTIEEIRRQLIQAIDSYKIRGTYQSLQIAAFLVGFTIGIKDYYTKDYLTFVGEDWFVASSEGEVPSGLATSDATSESTVVASASSTNGANAASRAIDNNLANYWESTSVAGPWWWKIDFGSSILAKVITEYKLICGGTATDVTRMPTSWILQGSTDNTTWVDLDTRTGVSWAASETKTYGVKNNTYYRYYRFYLTAVSSGTQVRITEIEMREVYYKSPHFGIEVNLNQAYGTYPSQYLWAGANFTAIINYIESVRPVNTVPHYVLLAEPQANEHGALITQPGNIRSIIKGSWTVSQKKFDATAGDAWKFDNGIKFDQSTTTFLSSITKYKLSAGNKNTSPDASSYTFGTPVLSGSILQTRYLADRTEFEIVVDKTTVQNGISELGLYLNDNTTIVLASTFPDINKESGVELKFVVTVFK